MSSNKKVLYVGCLGFPFGSATVYRKLQIASILNHLGYTVLVINRRGAHTKEYAYRENIKVFGLYKEINYIHTSLKSYKPNNFIVRNLYKILGLALEFIVILYQKVFCKSKFMFCDSTNSMDLKYYFYLSRLFKLKFVYDYVEFVDSLSNRDAYSISELNIKFEKNIDKYADAYIVISQYLYNSLGKLNNNSKRVIIPPTQNFENFDTIQKVGIDQKFFLYCGAINYKAAIEFVIEAYINSKAIEEEIKLYLVINGTELEIAELQDYVKEKRCEKQIIILTQLPYHLLISYYKSAEALLLPLRNTIQDQARFPFKIGEYLASQRPIITSNVGVISEYFVSEKDALIAIPDDIVSFVDKINFVILNPNAATEIGYNGYLLGKSKFSNNIYNDNLSHLLEL